jgi:predicted dehydrogenase
MPDIQRNEDAVLAALCRRDANALVHLAHHFEPEATFTDWKGMLERCPLDAVLIATPHNLHYEPAKAALERGLHVLIEKPMTVRSEEARELKHLAEERGLVLGVALNAPYWAHCHRIRGAIKSGRIGEVEALTMFFTGNAEYVFGEAPKPADLPGMVQPTMYRGDPEACGGGYLIDGGSHLISEALWVTGLRAKSVSCHMDSTPSDRRGALLITLENGALVTISTLGDSKHSSRRVQNIIAGTAGTITVEGFEFLTRVEEHGGEPEEFTERDLPPVPGPVDNFITAIRGHGHLASPAEHGLHVVEVVEAAYKSASTGQRVEL